MLEDSGIPNQQLVLVRVCAPSSNVAFAAIELSFATTMNCRIKLKVAWFGASCGLIKKTMVKQKEESLEVQKKMYAKQLQMDLELLLTLLDWLHTALLSSFAF
jgi:hypothetical protein